MCTRVSWCITCHIYTHVSWPPYCCYYCTQCVLYVLQCCAQLYCSLVPYTSLSVSQLCCACVDNNVNNRAMALTFYRCACLRCYLVCFYCKNIFILVRFSFARAYTNVMCVMLWNVGCCHYWCVFIYLLCVDGVLV